MRKLQQTMPEPSLAGLAANRGSIWENRQQVREETAQQFDDAPVEREDVPVRRREGGLAPAAPFVDFAAPFEAAAEFERQHSDVPGGFGPEDVVERGGGFGLAEPAQKRVAANDLDDQYPDASIAPEDVEQTGDGWGLDPFGTRKVMAAAYEDETPLDDVDPQDDLTRDGDEFDLTRDALERAYEKNPLFF